MKDILSNNAIVTAVPDKDQLARGQIIRRISQGKDQQGCFMNFDDQGDLIVVNVIDCNDASYLAPAGIMRIKEGDELYRYTDSFGKDQKSGKALAVIQEWPLFKKNPDLSDAIIYFISTTYSPSQVLYLRDRDMLKYVFVPIQQKFRIGRFMESVDWDTVRKQSFSGILQSMKYGDHITYIAMIPQQKTHKAMFYSIGTKPHQETEISLRSEPFNFVPTHGGHIKALKTSSGSVEYLVDAGSNYLGRGTGTSIDTAREIVKALSSIYRDFHFIAVEGRGAFGSEQSY